MESGEDNGAESLEEKACALRELRERHSARTVEKEAECRLPEELLEMQRDGQRVVRSLTVQSRAPLAAAKSTDLVLLFLVADRSLDLSWTPSE